MLTGQVPHAREFMAGLGSGSKEGLSPITMKPALRTLPPPPFLAHRPAAFAFFYIEPTRFAGIINKFNPKNVPIDQFEPIGELGADGCSRFLSDPCARAGLLGPRHRPSLPAFAWCRTRLAGWRHPLAFPGSKGGVGLVPCGGSAFRCRGPTPPHTPGPPLAHPQGTRRS